MKKINYNINAGGQIETVKAEIINLYGVKCALVNSMHPYGRSWWVREYHTSARIYWGGYKGDTKAQAIENAKAMMLGKRKPENVKRHVHRAMKKFEWVNS